MTTGRSPSFVINPRNNCTRQFTWLLFTWAIVYIVVVFSGCKLVPWFLEHQTLHSNGIFLLSLEEYISDHKESAWSNTSEMKHEKLIIFHLNGFENVKRCNWICWCERNTLIIGSITQKGWPVFLIQYNWESAFVKLLQWHLAELITSFCCDSDWTQSSISGLKKHLLSFTSPPYYLSVMSMLITPSPQLMSKRGQHTLTLKCQHANESMLASVAQLSGNKALCA